MFIGSQDKDRKNTEIENQRGTYYPVPVNEGDYFAPPEEEPHLRDYLAVLLRRKWITLTFFLIVVTTVAISTFMMKPVYRAGITLQIDKERPNILSDKASNTIVVSNENDIETQCRIIKSKGLAAQVIRTMKLDRSPEFMAKETLQRQPSPDLDNDKRPIDQRLVDSFRSRLIVAPVKGSQLIEVSFESHDPRLSADIANTIGKSFIDYSMQNSLNASQQAREWLGTQLEEMRAKVERTEEALNKYAAEKGIIFVSEGNSGGEGGKGGSGGENFVTKKLEEVSTQLVQATSERISKEVLYKEVQEGNSIPLAMTNQALQEMKRQHTAVETQYADLLKLYKPDYPKMIRLREQMAQYKKAMDQEMKSVMIGLKGDYAAAVKREEYLRSAFENYRREALEFNDKMVQYKILMRDAETNRELYNGLLQRMKETGIAASFTSSNIQIVDSADLPRAPERPKKSKNILLGIIIGLIGGIGLAFFVDYLDSSVKTPEDVEKRLLLPSLGLVPLFSKAGASNALIVHHDKTHQFTEVYRSIGTYIQFSSAEKPPKIMLITSAKAGEGKTTTAVNTALSLAHSSEKGIIIDTDMRKPQLHKIFSVDNSQGLSGYLTGNVELDNGLIQETSLSNLHLIPAGIIPPNPSELLSSRKMKDLLTSLSSIYTFIILDAPPLLGLSDSLVLSTQTDGVIMVVKAGDTPRDVVTQGKKLLRGVNAKILGVVLNGIKEADLKYGAYAYYYSYYSDDSEGADGGKKKKGRKTAKA